MISAVLQWYRPSSYSRAPAHYRDCSDQRELRLGRLRTARAAPPLRRLTHTAGSNDILSGYPDPDRPPALIGRRAWIVNEGVAMSYIDGFVIAVPTANKQTFIEHARSSDQVFLDHGALRVL